MNSISLHPRYGAPLTQTHQIHLPATDRDETLPDAPLTQARALHILGHLVRHAAGQPCLRVTALEPLLDAALRGNVLRAAAGYRPEVAGAQLVAVRGQRPGARRVRYATVWSTRDRAVAVTAEFTWLHGKWLVTHWAIL